MLVFQSHTMAVICEQKIQIQVAVILGEGEETALSYALLAKTWKIRC